MAVAACTAFLLLVLAGPGDGPTDWRTVTVYDGKVTLQIPDQWNEISPELLDYFSLRAAELSGGRTAETYQYGFRPAQTEVGFELPQLLIQIREDGRLRYGQFLRLPDPGQVVAGQADRAADDGGPFIRDVRLDRLTFDDDRMILFVDSTMDLLIEGGTSVRSASILTEHGVFVLHYYQTIDGSSPNDPIFERIVDGVSFNDELRYRPRWHDRLSTRQVPYLLFALAAVVGLIAITQRRARSRRRPTDHGH